MFVHAVMSSKTHGPIFQKSFSRKLNVLKKVEKMEKFHFTSALIVTLSIRSVIATKIGRRKGMLMLKFQDYDKNSRHLVRELIVLI